MKLVRGEGGGELEQKTLQEFYRRSLLGGLEVVDIKVLFHFFFKNLSLKNFFENNICLSLVKKDSRKKYFL